MRNAKVVIREYNDQGKVIRSHTFESTNDQSVANIFTICENALVNAFNSGDYIDDIEEIKDV